MKKHSVIPLMTFLLFLNISNNSFGMKRFFKKIGNLFKKPHTVPTRREYPVFVVRFRDGTTKLWDVETGQCFATFSEDPIVAEMEWWAARDQLFKNDIEALFFCQTRKQLKKVIYSDPLPTSFNEKRVYDNFGDLFARKNGKEIEICDFQTGQLVKILEGHTEDIESLLFSPNGELLASVAWGRIQLESEIRVEIKLWDVQTGTCLKTLEDAAYNPLHIVFILDGVPELLFGQDGKSLFYFCKPLDCYAKKWDVQTGELLETFNFGDHNKIDLWRMVVFANDRNVIWIDSKSKKAYVHILNLAKKRSRCFARFPLGPHKFCAAVCHYGNLVAIASEAEDHKIEEFSMFDIERRRFISTLEGQYRGHDLICSAFIHDFGGASPRRVQEQQEERLQFLCQQVPMPGAIQVQAGDAVVNVPRAFLLQ